MFERGEIKDGIQIANTLVVPALAQLSRESRTEGEKVLEKVREEWCQCLNRPDLNEGKISRDNGTAVELLIVCSNGTHCEFPFINAECFQVITATLYKRN